MCFSIDHNHPKEKIAYTDKLVYKYGRNTGESRRKGIFVPLYRPKFKYQKGVLQKKVDLKVDAFEQIEHGYHSYIERIKFSEKRDSGCYTKGIFLLPKGSKYYINTGGRYRNPEIVSNQLIFLDMFDEKTIEKYLKEYKDFNLSLFKKQ